MLYAIREHATGWIAYLIIFLISIPFALWGINEYLGFGGGAEAAEVDGVAIPLEAYHRAYRQRRAQEEPSGERDRELQRAVLDDMIERELLQQYMDRQRLDVTDLEVMESIQTMEWFSTADGFDPQRYRNILRTNNLTPAQFEAQQRNLLRGHILQQALDASALITEAEARAYRTLKDQTRDFRYFSLPYDRFLEPDAIAAEAIEAAYREDLERHATPAHVRVAHLALHLDGMDADAEPSDADLQAYHEAHALDFMAPELRRLRQIFFKKAADAEARAQEAHRQLQEGAEFAALAQEQSEDSLSRARGGAVGWVAQDDLPDELGTLVFSMEPGRISEPLATERGTYLLEVEEVRPGRLKPLEEVRAQVAAHVQRQDLERRYAAAAEELSALAYENPDSLAAAAEQLGLEVHTTERVALDALPEGVLRQPAVQAALQRDEVLKEGLNSDRIDLDENTAVVVRVDEYEASRTRPLEEVAVQIRDELARQAAREALLEHAAALLEQLRGNADLAALAAQEEVPVAAYEGLTRDDPEVEPAVLEHAFLLAHPGETPVFGMAVLPEAVAVMALDAVRAEPPEEAQPLDRERLRQQMRNAETDAFQTALEARADVVRYLDRLE